MERNLNDEPLAANAVKTRGGPLGRGAAFGASRERHRLRFAAPSLVQDDVTLNVWGGVPPENGPQALCRCLH